MSIFAADELDRHWRRIARTRKTFDQLDARRRHKLRIRAKKLRYGVEFFASLFPDRKPAKRRRALAKALKRLQSNLGDLNDFAAHRQLARQKPGALCSYSCTKQMSGAKRT